MKFGFDIILIFVLPFSTAIIFGVIADRLGAKVLTGLAAMGGLGLGLYFLSSCFRSSSFVDCFGS